MLQQHLQAGSPVALAHAHMELPHAWEQLPSHTRLFLVMPRALADEEGEGMDVQNKHSPIMLAWVEAKIFTFPY